jgi:hypothetical protein
VTPIACAVAIEGALDDDSDDAGATAQC